MEKIVHISILFGLILFKTSYLHAQHIPDWAKTGGGSYYDMLKASPDALDGTDTLLKQSFNMHVNSYNRSRALDVDQVCEPVVGSKNENFCEEKKDEKVEIAEQELESQLENKMREQKRLCHRLSLINEGIASAIETIDNEIKNMEEQIRQIDTMLAQKEDHISNIKKANPSLSDDGVLKKFFDDAEAGLNDLEASVATKKSNLLFLKNGSGEAPVKAWNPNLNLETVKAEKEIACAPAVVKPDDFNGGVLAKSEKVEYSIAEDGLNHPHAGVPSNLTKTFVEVKMVNEVVEDNPDLATERQKLDENVSSVEQRISTVTLSIDGHSRKGEPASGILPAINGVRESINQLRELAGVRRGQEYDCGVGLAGCNKDGGGSGNGGQGSGVAGGGNQPGAGGSGTRGPQDGLAYGGGSSNGSDSSQNTSSDSAGGVMAKTGGSNGFGGFGMPSLGGSSGSSSKNATDYANNYGAASVNQNHGGGYSRSWGSGNSFNNGFNSQGIKSNRGRGVANSDSSIHGSNVYSNSSGTGGGFQGGGLATMSNAGSNGGGAYDNTPKTNSRFSKKGNKQVFSSRTEKLAGGQTAGLTRQERARRAELESRMNQLKTERKLAGQDAFDPDKYIPRTHAEKMALARASGKLGGHTKSNQWPKDISRSSEQDIFNLMIKGYRKHLNP